MVAATAEARTCQRFAVPGHRDVALAWLVTPTGAPGPRDYPCLPLGWAAPAQATHLLLLGPPRGAPCCTGASWEMLPAQGARYVGREQGQRRACSWASRDPGPRSLGRQAKRPQRAGRSGARPSRILRSASSAEAAFRSPHQPQHLQGSLTWVGCRSRGGARGYRRAPRRGAGCSARLRRLRRPPAAPRPRPRPSARGGSSPGHRARPLRRGCCHTKSRKWLRRGAPCAPLTCNLLLPGPRWTHTFLFQSVQLSDSGGGEGGTTSLLLPPSPATPATPEGRKRWLHSQLPSVKLFSSSHFSTTSLSTTCFVPSILSRARCALVYNRAPCPLGDFYSASIN